MGLFKKRSNQNTSQAPEKDLLKKFESSIPDAVFAQAKNEYFDVIGQPVVDKSRFFLLSFILGIICILLIILLIKIFPLKTIEPYVVYIDSTKGVIANDLGQVTRAADYTPERPVIERELYQFVDNLYAMNADYPRIVKQGHTNAFSYVRGKAIEEFRSFLNNEQVYQRQKTTPGLMRNIEKKTVSFKEDGKLVLIRFTSTEKNNAMPVGVNRDWMITIQFERHQPTTKEDINKNPLGIYITHFEITEERL